METNSRDRDVAGIGPAGGRGQWEEISSRGGAGGGAGGGASRGSLDCDSRRKRKKTFLQSFLHVHTASHNA